MELCHGDVVQLAPAHSKEYGGLLAIVDDVNDSGVFVYVLVPGVDGQSPTRLHLSCRASHAHKIGVVPHHPDSFATETAPDGELPP